MSVVYYAWRCETCGQSGEIAENDYGNGHDCPIKPVLGFSFSWHAENADLLRRWKGTYSETTRGGTRPGLIPGAVDSVSDANEEVDDVLKAIDLAREHLRKVEEMELAVRDAVSHVRGTKGS